MKAVVYSTYGLPDVLQFKEVDQPVPGDHDVLIKTYAASINSWDWDLLRGEPFIVRLAGGGLFKPKKKIIGCDVAGTVEKVGKKVTKFKAGDAVLGDLSGGGWGAFAEYVCAPENSLTRKPDGMTFEQASSLPQAGVMALQGVRDYGKVEAGQKVLINGAGGGVGTLAIQMAKMYGAEVTGVDKTNKLEIMQQLGADHVIDFTKEDFTKSGNHYDIILDVVGHHSIYDYKRSLEPGGMYRMIGGPHGLIFQSIFIGPIISMFSKKKMGILTHEPNKNMNFLIQLFEEGKVKPVIDKVFPLQELVDAFRYFGQGDFMGKVVIVMRK
ncbi:MAG: NAD(P)-dependent alcohol dehydrogenase [Flammeovirgaceae bacterium]|nr:NAD(P)-dependent alcohol dehydrogenase [Flammeovirgaceae bacterium]